MKKMTSQRMLYCTFTNQQIAAMLVKRTGGQRKDQDKCCTWQKGKSQDEAMLSSENQAHSLINC